MPKATLPGAWTHLQAGAPSWPLLLRALRNSPIHPRIWADPRGAPAHPPSKGFQLLSGPLLRESWEGTCHGKLVTRGGGPREHNIIDNNDKARLRIREWPPRWYPRWDEAPILRHHCPREHPAEATLQGPSQDTVPGQGMLPGTPWDRGRSWGCVLALGVPLTHGHPATLTRIVATLIFIKKHVSRSEFH